MYLPNYGPRKTWLDKSLESKVWEDPLTGDVVNGPKHWFNLNESTFAIFTDQYESN